MGTAFLLGSLTVVVFVWQAAIGTDPGWTEWNGHQYKWLSDEIGAVTRDEAERACRGHCAYLAVPSSPAENEFLWSMYRAWSPDNALWIGCSQDENGDWSCAEGERGGIDTGYRNWNPDFLHLVNDPGRCSVIAHIHSAEEDGQWNPNLCKGPTKYVICEKEIRQPFNDRAMCDSTGEGCTALELVRRLESRHLSRVATTDGGSRYTVDEGPTGSTPRKYSLSAAVTEGRMRVAFYDVGIDYCDGN